MDAWKRSVTDDGGCNVVVGNPRNLLSGNVVPAGWESVPKGYGTIRRRPTVAAHPHDRLTQRRKAAFAAGALMLVATLLFFACGEAFSSVSTEKAEELRAVLLAPADDSPASTPQSEWRKGSFPYLYQTDDQWKDVAYAEDTIEKSGCGPTSLSMVYVGLTGKTDHTPVTLSAFSEAAGYVDHGMTSWTYMTEGASAIGLKSRELPADANVITSALRAGEPVIASMAPGDFTDVGHFIVLCGVNDDGSIEIRDPNSPARSHQPWPLERLIPQARNFWAFH